MILPTDHRPEQNKKLVVFDIYLLIRYDITIYYPTKSIVIIENTNVC